MSRFSDRQGAVFANPFFVSFMAVSTLFVVTALAYLASVYAIQGLAADGKPAEGMPLALWVDQHGPMALLVEILAMGGTSVLSMITDQWFSKSG